MGSGASTVAGVGAAIQGASPEDLQASLNTLARDDRKKLEACLEGYATLSPAANSAAPVQEPLQLNGTDYAFVSSRVLEGERAEIYKRAYAELGDADKVVAIVAEANGEKKEFIAAAKGESSNQPKTELVKTICAITLADMTPSEGIEYVFKEDPGAWAITPLSKEALEAYRKSKFQTWMDMLLTSECEAQLRRMLQTGVINTMFDDNVFPTPSAMSDLFKVKCEKTGKVVNIPHPVQELRVWNANEGKYDVLETLLEGAPKEEDKDKFWADFIVSLKEKRGEEYIEGLMNNGVAEDEEEDVCFACVEHEAATS